MKFGEGDKVRYDDDGVLVEGRVVFAREDKIYVKWDDLVDPSIHHKPEFDDIEIIEKARRQDDDGGGA